ncbi:precorrin-6y C5,15-methyltransferase (decarboxylating) subunit CbiE [Thioclava sp. FR2]|uniref:precorrin-6y C5,15-methyltransferase (decarboxylating) subunit CbiE n=1 Tax=Thioclava sp. FR2 TaxID=3445780 RepID=UPI003EB9EBCD
MSDPWLSIIGLGEDGLAGLSDASKSALADAEVVFGGSRHLALTKVGARGREWPIPFDLAPLLALRGKKVVMLASGDPFWFGAGGSVSSHLTPDEWRSFPSPSIFSLVAARMGWKLEEALCLGLHAAPYARLAPILSRGVRAICTLRDGTAVQELADWMASNGFGETEITVCEALGGPREKVRRWSETENIAAPVAVALDGAALPKAAGIPRASGLSDDLFFSDGQITKRPIRALTLSALAPRSGEVLWDIGAGSGSVSVEWCVSGGRAICVEARSDRIPNIRANAEKFGVSHRVAIVHSRAKEAVSGLERPDAVFVGGGGDAELYSVLWNLLPEGTRLVANGVTLETEAVLAACHARHGGALMRFDVAEATSLGGFRGWSASRPVVQWSVVK